VCRYLHEKRIVHRDIKPANILVTEDWTAQLTDFGISRSVDNDKTLTKMVGTAAYMAPELLDDSIAGNVDDADAAAKQVRREAVDVYAFGILVAEIFNAHPPYETVSAALIGCVAARVILTCNVLYADFFARYCTTSA